MFRYFSKLFLSAIFIGWSSLATSQIFISNDFNSSVNGFEGRFNEGSNYTESWSANSGYNGSGGSRLVMMQNREQFTMGWFFDGTKPGAAWTWNDIAYVRFRIRFDDDYRWDGTGSQQNKLLDFGGDDSRVILHNERDRPTTPCGLKNIDYSQPGQPVSNTEADYGLPAGAFDNGNWGSLALKRGINEPCTPPVIVSHGVWYHVQLAVKISSAANRSDGYFKLWLNNNDIQNPSTQILNIVQGLLDWNNSWTFGGYWTNANQFRNQGWIVDDFQMGDQFDSNWAPDSSLGNQQPLPSPLEQQPNVDLLSENFESAAWDKWVGTRGNLEIANDNCAEGNLCARATLVENTDDNNYADFTFGDHVTVGDPKIEEVYLQMYSKISAGYSWPNRSHKIAIFNLTDGVSTARRYQVYVYADPSGRYAVDYTDIDNWVFNGLSQNVGTPVNVSSGQWDKLKLRVRLNTPGSSNGVIELWVNDELKLSYNNVNIRLGTNYGLNKFILSSYSTRTTGSSGTQWYDEVLVSTQNITNTLVTTPQAPELFID